MLNILHRTAAGGLALSGSPNPTLAQRLLSSGFDPQSLRTLDVLRKDEWKQIDQTVIDVARQRLTIVNDFRAAGMTYDLPNAMGTTVLEFERMTGMEGAEVNMTGIAEGPNDRVTFDLDSLPIPIIHRDFHINIRALEASRRRGSNLDTTQAAEATRLVVEKTEEIVVNGYSAVTVGGKTIYGLKTAPNRSTGTCVNWANYPTVDGEDILAQVIEMIGKMHADHQYGPYTLYVPLTYFTALGHDFKANSDKTVMQRLLEVPGLSAIKMSEYLADGASGEVILVNMQKSTADLVMGMQPTPIMWDSHGGMVVHFKVMSIIVPRMKYDSSLQSGIVHYSI